jgi:hypothetical protein
MRRDVALLRSHASYVTCTTVVLCCIDAIAAAGGDADPGKFRRFVNKHFPVLCTELSGAVAGKSGSMVLYDKFRNGFAHLRGPKSGFAIAENHELKGRYAGELEAEGFGKFMAINVDRFIDDFLRLVEALEQGAA